MGIELTGIDRLRRSQCFDLIPVVSSFSNLIELFIRYVILPFKGAEAVKGSRYFTHLKEKPLAHFLLLLVPVLGNIIVWMLNRSEKQKLMAEIGKDYNSARLVQVFENLAPKFAVDEEILDLLIMRDLEGLIYPVSRMAQQSRPLTITAIRLRGWMFVHADPRLQSDEELIFLALEDWCPAAAHLPQEKAEQAVEKNPLSFLYLPHLHKDEARILEAYKRSPTEYKSLFQEKFPACHSRFETLGSEDSGSDDLPTSPVKLRPPTAEEGELSAAIRAKNDETLCRVSASVNEVKKSVDQLKKDPDPLCKFGLAFHQTALRNMGRHREAEELPQKVPPAFRFKRVSTDF
jgi:hypothetical protein